MKPVTRSIAIIRPKRHFMKWANANSLDDHEFALEYFANHHSLAVSIPYFDILARNQAKRYITDRCGLIFDYQLKNWNPDENTWPKDRSKELFNKLFTVDFVYDVVE